MPDALRPSRADVALVARGLARSRTLARRLIEAGAVLTDAQGGEVPVQRASQPIYPDQTLRVLESDTDRYVSRGGNKLEAALEEAGIDCHGLDALDVGMSTGGFTHCLLMRGIRQVVGVEVGHSQLADLLQRDPRVRCLEHTHIREVGLPQLHLPDGTEATDGFALIVVDLSFIAASQLLLHLATLARPGGRLVCLIKPQFELGPDALNKQGIVRKDADLEGLRQHVMQAARQAGWRADAWLTCAITGGDGNQEYFLIATRQTARPMAHASTAPRAPLTSTGPHPATPGTSTGPA